MKINKLKLRGAIGIWKGLGKEEIEIDFTQFGPGLIALTGKNGSGKTTVMENLHPYRCMVSRTGSLQSHFFLKDSYRMLEFEHNGKRYESKILIDALTGGSEAYLLENGTPLNDGKLTTYDEVIESVLGSQELFFNSVFSGQKSKGIAELKPSGRRKLFYELLNLNIYEKYLEQAKAKLKNNELKFSEIEGKIQSLQTDDEEKIKLENDRIEALENQAKLTNDISNLENEISEIESSIQGKEKEMIVLEQKKKRNEFIHEKINSLKNNIIELIEKKEKKLYEIKIKINDNELEISENGKLTENEDEIKNNIAELEQIKSKISALERDLSKLMKEKINFIQQTEDERKEFFEKEKQLNQLKEQINEYKRNYDSIENEITGNNEEAEIIDDVPCSTEIGKQCRFLKKAYAKKEQIPELEKMLQQTLDRVKTAEEKYKKEKAEFDEKRTAFEDYAKDKLGNFEKIFSKINNEIEPFKKKKEELEKTDWQKLLEKSKAAQKNIELLQNQIEVLKAQAKLIQENHLSRVRELQEEIKRLEEEANPDVEKSLSETELNLSRLKVSLREKKENLTEMKDWLDRSKTIIANIEAQQKTIAENEKKIKELESEKGKTQSEIKDWTFLVKAFDKTGIPVLKLENSGIEITTIANELLALFENQFRIVFETTQLTKDKKKMKETFNINVLSGDDVVEISNLSGGQQVWVETAIQLAISLLVRQQGNNIETSFLDEKDGALDIENAHLYLNMLKLAHQKSGVHNTFVITHRPELIDLIPQKITLGDGLLLSEVA